MGKELRIMDKEELIQEILKLKLHTDWRGNIYCPEYGYAISYDTGIWQFPDELADLLLFLKDKDIKSFLNIGTYNGITFNFMADYLNRFNEVTCITLDPNPFDFQKNPKYTYIRKTSHCMVGRPFDFVFIDGDHSYTWTEQDFNNVGRYARYCAFHDIKDKMVRETLGYQGGSGQFWDAIKENFCYTEFNSEKKTHEIMGIGVLWKSPTN